MRAIYNTTCDIIDGPGTASPGTVRHAAVPCRLVVETIIKPFEKWLRARTHYVTLDEANILGGFVEATSPTTFTVDTDDADRLAIPSGAAAGYTVIFTEVITPLIDPVYRRAHVVNVP